MLKYITIMFPIPHLNALICFMVPGAALLGSTGPMGHLGRTSTLASTAPSGGGARYRPRARRSTPVQATIRPLSVQWLSRGECRCRVRLENARTGRRMGKEKSSTG